MALPVCNVGAGLQVEDSQVGEVHPFQQGEVADVAVVGDVQLLQLRQHPQFPQTCHTNSYQYMALQHVRSEDVLE